MLLYQTLIGKLFLVWNRETHRAHLDSSKMHENLEELKSFAAVISSFLLLVQDSVPLHDLTTPKIDVVGVTGSIPVRST